MTILLDRLAFATSRLLDFFSEKELTAQVGHPKQLWPLVVLKELLDNALDACEDAGIAPEITVTVDDAGISVRDNGPGIPPETVRGVLDFAIRVSSREAYVSPTRGAQGNALKTLVAMPFVLDQEQGGRVEVEARGICHEINVAVDRIKQEDGAAIHLVNTDPPYNVRVEPRSNNAIAAGLSSFSNDAAAKKLRSGQGNAAFDIARGRTKVPGTMHHQGLDLARHPKKAKPTGKKLRAKDRPLANDFVSDEAFEQMLRAWFGNLARVLAPGRTFYIWGGYANCGNYPPVLKATGLYFSQAIIWDKQHPVLTRKDFMGAHEWCFYGWREGAAHVFLGPANVRDLWSIKKVNPQSMIHLTEKPVELAVRAMQYSSRAGENVLDLFGGSGSTLIAAEQTGRRAFLMELDCLYADVIVQRYEQFTGKKAERVAAEVAEVAP